MTSNDLGIDLGADLGTDLGADLGAGSGADLGAGTASVDCSNMTGTAGTELDANYEEEPMPFQAIAFLWVLAVLVCMCAKPSIPDETHHWNRRQGGNAQSQRGKKRKIDPEERMKMIAAALITQKGAVHGQTNVITLQRDQGNTLQTEVGQAANVPLSNASAKEPLTFEDAAADEEEDGIACMICLELFEIGEEVSWSRQMHCRHVFHRECISQWLMKADECPCCRTEYLSSESTLPSKKNPENDASSDSDDSTTQNSAFYIIHGLISRRHSARYLFARLPPLGDGSDQIDRLEAEQQLGDESSPGVAYQSNTGIEAGEIQAHPDLERSSSQNHLRRILRVASGGMYDSVNTEGDEVRDQTTRNFDILSTTQDTCETADELGNVEDTVDELGNVEDSVDELVNVEATEEELVDVELGENPVSIRSVA